MQVTKTITFDAAHRLRRHPGACRNLHGHTYKVEVTVEGRVVEGGAGIVIDFSMLSRLLKRLINEGAPEIGHEEPFDHACILEHDDTLLDKLPSILRIVRTAEAPTAEHFATLFADAMGKLLESQGIMHARVRRVTVRETPTSFATWDVDDDQ